MAKYFFSFHRKVHSTVIVNGQTTALFSFKRGCGQGDSVLQYLFVLCVEILAVMIRENSDSDGICINEAEHKLSQLMNNGDEISFEKSLQNNWKIT